MTERNAMAVPWRARHNQQVSTKAFWDDLARDLGDPEFRREYVSAAANIAAVDTAINAGRSVFDQTLRGDDDRSG